MSHRARALDKQAPPSVTELRGGCNKQWRRYGLRRACVQVSSSDNNKLTPPLGMPMPSSGFGANLSRGRFAVPAMPCSQRVIFVEFSSIGLKSLDQARFCRRSSHRLGQACDRNASSSIPFSLTPPPPLLPPPPPPPPCASVSSKQAQPAAAVQGLSKAQGPKIRKINESLFR